MAWVLRLRRRDIYHPDFLMREVRPPHLEIWRKMDLAKRFPSEIKIVKFRKYEDAVLDAARRMEIMGSSLDGDIDIIQVKGLK